MPMEILNQANLSPSGPSRSTPAAVKVAVVGGSVGGQQSPAPAEEANAAPVNQEQLKAAMSQISNYVQNVQRNLNFSIDEASGQTIVKVIDSESEEVIRQIPSEEMLALARRLSELGGEQVSGLLMQSKA